MDLTLVLSVVGIVVAFITAYIALEQLRRTPKSPVVVGEPAAPASVASRSRPPLLEHPVSIPVIWVGRTLELKALNIWIEDSKSPPLFCLEGLPGIGKSSLAWKWLQEQVLTNQERLGLDGVFQWSFSEGRGDLGECLDALAKYLDLEPNGNDPITVLSGALSRRRLLLVLDGVERLLSAYSPKIKEDPPQTDHEAVTADRNCADIPTSRWFRMLAVLTNTKALLIGSLLPVELDHTSACRRLLLTELMPDEAVAYLRGRGIKGHNRELQEAASFLGRHPLSLERLANVLHYDLVNPDDIARAEFHTPASADVAARQRDVLRNAFETLPADLQEYMGKLSAVRGTIPIQLARVLASQPTDWALVLCLRRLEEDHWLSWDRGRNCLEIVPIIRHYAYDHLSDKQAVHEKLRGYFSMNCPPPGLEGNSVLNLTNVIELYHHTVRVGRLDDAAALFFESLYHPLSIRFGMVSTLIELLSDLLTKDEALHPQLSSPAQQYRVLNALAYANRLAGKSSRVSTLYREATVLAQEQGSVDDVAFGLRNILRQHILTGDLSSAHSVQVQHFQLAKQAGSASLIGLSHRDFGVLKSICGDVMGARQEFDCAEQILQQAGDTRRVGMVWAYRARLAKWEEDASLALAAATKARELADVESRERDIIWAEWMLGAAHRLRGDATQAQAHLFASLNSCRWSGMTDLEPDILLELARLQLETGTGRDHLTETRQYVSEAMLISTRCGYQLMEADAHVLLGQLAWKDRDGATAANEANTALQLSARHGYQYWPARKDGSALLGNFA